VELNEDYDGVKHGTVVAPSIINYQMQKSLDFVPPPVGPDDNAPLRLPTRAGNEASGKTGLVKRGVQYNKVVDAGVNEPKTKVKEVHSASPEHMINNISKNSERLSSTLKSMSDNMDNGQPSEKELALKVEKFEFQKEIMNRKIEIETNHVTLENKKAHQECLNAKLRAIDE
jgi:hypothetical protein